MSLFPFLHSVASLTNTHCDWLTPTTFQLTLPFSNQDGCLGDEAPCSPFSPSPSYKLSPSGSTLPNVSLGAIGTGLNPQNFAARQVRRPLRFVIAWLWPHLGPALQFIASFVCLGKLVDYWMHRMISSVGFYIFQPIEPISLHVSQHGFYFKSVSFIFSFLVITDLGKYEWDSYSI